MSDRTYDFEREPEEPARPDEVSPVERASENVFDGWPEPSLEDPPELDDQPEPDGQADAPASAPGSTWERAEVVAARPDQAPDQSAPAQPTPVPQSIPADGEPVWRPSSASGAWDEEPSEENVIVEPSGVMGVSEHAPGELMIPPGVPVLEGSPNGERRAVGIVVSRFNGHVTSKLLEGALTELSDRGVETGSITVMPVPGAFELPIAAMALAKTRRFACIVALGCVIRGDTPHFDYVSSEAASGLQLAAIETGVPVAFGVLTLDRSDQAEARYDKGAEAVRTGLEMADLFANLRAAASR